MPVARGVVAKLEMSADIAKCFLRDRIALAENPCVKGVDTAERLEHHAVF